MAHSLRELYIPDLHTPYTNMDYLNKVYEFSKVFKPDVVWQLGDFVDFYNFSRFLKSPMAESLPVEIKRARAQVKRMAQWFPNMRLLEGNHERRLYKRAKEIGIPKFWLRGIPEVLEAPKSWIFYPQDHNFSNGVMKAHGHLSSGNAKKTHMDFYMRNTVHGHIHNQLGIEFNPRTDKKIWGMSCSCIVDINSIAMDYSDQDFKNIICGFGYTDNGKPHVEFLG